MAFFELEEGVANNRRTLSMSMNASYHKEQQYIWFMGGHLNGFSDIMPFTKGWGHAVAAILDFYQISFNYFVFLRCPYAPQEVSTQMDFSL